MNTHLYNTISYSFLLLTSQKEYQIDQGPKKEVSIGYVIFMGFVIAITLALYFLPSIIAFARAKTNTWAIVILNTFLGWTFIGWVVALVLATTKDKD